MRRHLAALLLFELAAFGLFLPRLGFYHDDWVLLESCWRSGGFFESLRSLGAQFGMRPVGVIFYAAAYALGGLKPWPYHALMLAVEAAGACFAYLLFARLWGRRDLAFASCLLALLYPNHAATHHWFAASAQSLAVTLAMMGLWMHLRWSEEGGALRLAASLALYLASILCYESTVFFPLLLAAGLWARRPGATAPIAIRLAPFALPAFLWLLWQRLAPQWLGIVNPKSGGLSLAHALKVFGAGFECLTNRVLHASWTQLRLTLPETPWYFYLLAAGIVALAWAFMGVGAEDDQEPPVFVALVGGLGMFLAAYLPYALSADYQPQIFGLMSRTNTAGAWAGGLWIAALLFRWGPWFRRACLALLIGVFAAVDWSHSWAWARSWNAQQEILSRAAYLASKIEGPAVVFLSEAPREINGAVVFEAFWGFDAALRIHAGRSDLQGNIWEEFTRDPRGKRYQNPAFLYNARTDAFVKLPKESLTRSPSR